MALVSLPTKRVTEAGTSTHAFWIPWFIQQLFAAHLLCASLGEDNKYLLTVLFQDLPQRENLLSPCTSTCSEQYKSYWKCIALGTHFFFKHPLILACRFSDKIRGACSLLGTCPSCHLWWYFFDYFSSRVLYRRLGFLKCCSFLCYWNFACFFLSFQSHSFIPSSPCDSFHLKFHFPESPPI